MPPDGIGGLSAWLPGGSVLEAAAPVIADLVQVAASITISDALGESGAQVDAVGDEIGDGLEAAANALPRHPEAEARGLAHRLTSEVERASNRIRHEVYDATAELRRAGRDVNDKLSEVSASSDAVTAMANRVAASTDDELLQLGAAGLAGAATLISDSADRLQRMLEVDRERIDDATDDFERDLDRLLRESNDEFSQSVSRELERTNWRRWDTESLRRRLLAQAARIRLAASAYQLLVETAQTELYVILDQGADGALSEPEESNPLRGPFAWILAAMAGGLFLAAGLAGLIPALSENARAAVSVGGVVPSEDEAQPSSASSGSASLDSAALSPWMPAASPLPATVEVEDQSAAGALDSMMPTIVDFCAGIRHGSSSSVIFYDLRFSYVPTGALIGLTSYGPPGGTTPFFGEGTLDGDGYTRVQFDIFQFGSYAPQMVTVDNSGEVIGLPGSVVGGTVEVGSPEKACDPADLAPRPPEPEPDDTVKMVTATPGGGAVAAPAAASAPSEGTVVTATSPQLVATGGEATGSDDTSSDDDSNDTERAIGLGLVAAATAGLATVINPDLTGGTTRTARRRDQDSDEQGGSASTGPRTYTAEDRAFLQEIYKSASEAGVNILGLATVGSIEDAFAGSKAEPVFIGKAATLYVRVGPDGSLLPPRGHSDTAATSILKIDVRPGVEFGSGNDAHVVWNSHVTQIDTSTAKITDSSSAGPSNAEWKAKVGGRTDAEVGNDSAFKDWVVESMPSTPGEAVAQALGGAGVTN